MKNYIQRSGKTKPLPTDREGNLVLCNFCKTPLTFRRLSMLSPFDFNRTCFRHDHLRYVVNIHFWLRTRNKSLRKKLGIKQ